MHVFSIAEHLWDLLEHDPLWSLCVLEDKSSPLNWARTNKALADIVTTGGGLLRRLEDALKPLEAKSNSLLLVTDLEALHPFLRIGALKASYRASFMFPPSSSTPAFAPAKRA